MAIRDMKEAFTRKPHYELEIMTPKGEPSGIKLTLASFSEVATPEAKALIDRYRLENEKYMSDGKLKVPDDVVEERLKERVASCVLSIEWGDWGISGKQPKASVKTMLEAFDYGVFGEALYEQVSSKVFERKNFVTESATS